jgi:hypothetical protein
MAQDLSALSHYILTLPQHPGNRLAGTQCLELARLCEALDWKREAMAWHELALVRQPELTESNEALERLRLKGTPGRPAKRGPP